jgi:hypothetical protein
MTNNLLRNDSVTLISWIYHFDSTKRLWSEAGLGIMSGRSLFAYQNSHSCHQWHMPITASILETRLVNRRFPFLFRASITSPFSRGVPKPDDEFKRIRVQDGNLTSENTLDLWSDLREIDIWWNSSSPGSWTCWTCHLLGLGDNRAHYHIEAWIVLPKACKCVLLSD